ncbi:hypothetical protein IM538_04490 [Cytobacillus suaedae]|nr:hypothetical protein IM538_04490 [Cytobacillus suaedae]
MKSHSKTTNGVGSAYGDGSYINMSPRHSPVNDPNVFNYSQNLQPYYYPYYYPVPNYIYPMDVNAQFNPYINRNPY